MAALALGGAALVTACSTSTSSSTPSAAPTTSPAMTSPSATTSVSAATCQHAKSLRASLDSLTHLSLSANSATKIRSDLTNVQAQLTALKGQPGFATLDNQIKSSVDQVTKAANGMSSPPTGTQVQAVITALSGLKAKSSSAVAGLKAACP